VATPSPVVKHHPSANVYFGLNKTTLSPAAVTMLNAYVREIVKNDVTTLTINGFADAQGGLAHNEWLSKTRASVVASFIRAALAKAGDHKVAVTASGKGVLKSSVSYQLDRVVAITSK
jgi:outer membrane protein OmpA-like peptidoglycan-associated protein